MIEENYEPPDNSKLLIKNLLNTAFLKLNSNLLNQSTTFESLGLKIVSNIEECKNIWNYFSPKQSLFDLWDFRFSWYQGYQFKPYFYTLYEKDKPLACLPLWFDPEKKRYEWFGSDWMEDNSFFYSNKIFIELLLKMIPKNTYLNAIKDDVYKISLPKDLEIFEDYPKFVLNLTHFSNMDEYLLTLSKKHRHNFKRDYYNILHLHNPKIEIFYSNDFSYFEEIIKLSKKRFNGTLKDHTDLTIPQRIRTYKSLLKNQGKYQVKFVLVKIQNYVAAIDLIILFNAKYYSLKGANDIDRFPGIGNFINYIEIQDAILNKYVFFDCLQMDYNWKHKYLTPLNLFKLIPRKKAT